MRQQINQTEWDELSWEEQILFRMWWQQAYPDILQRSGDEPLLPSIGELIAFLEEHGGTVKIEHGPWGLPRFPIYWSVTTPANGVGSNELIIALWMLTSLALAEQEAAGQLALP